MTNLPNDFCVCVRKAGPGDFEHNVPSQQFDCSKWQTIGWNLNASQGAWQLFKNSLIVLNYSNEIRFSPLRSSLMTDWLHGLLAPKCFPLNAPFDA